MTEKKILDIGCGDNPNREATHFIDINPKYVTMENGKTWDVNHPLPYEDGTFDKVYCTDIMEHLKIPVEVFLVEMRRILKFQGDLVIRVPNCMWWYHRLVYLLGYIPDDFFLAHRKHFTRRYLYNALDNCGFKVRFRRNCRVFIECIGADITIIARRFE